MTKNTGVHYIYLQRRATFCAAHRLVSPHLSEEENKVLYGKCNRKNGHGHNYVIWVTIKGIMNPKTGLLINMQELKDIVYRLVIQRFDHLNLNVDVPELEGLITSAENLAIVSWNLLKAELGDMLYEVKIRETENNFAIYRGEQKPEDINHD